MKAGDRANGREAVCPTLNLASLPFSLSPAYVPVGAGAATTTATAVWPRRTGSIMGSMPQSRVGGELESEPQQKASSKDVGRVGRNRGDSQGGQTGEAEAEGTGNGGGGSDCRSNSDPDPRLGQELEWKQLPARLHFDSNPR